MDERRLDELLRGIDAAIREGEMLDPVRTTLAIQRQTGAAAVGDPLLELHDAIFKKRDPATVAKLLAESKPSDEFVQAVQDSLIDVGRQRESAENRENFMRTMFNRGGFGVDAAIRIAQTWRGIEKALQGYAKDHRQIPAGRGRAFA